MEEIRKIARKICHFRCDYAAKFRTVSDTADIRVWVNNLSYENLDSSARISYHDPLATFTATANQDSHTTFTITPKIKYEWLSLSLLPSPDGFLRPSLSLQSEMPITKRTVASGVATFVLNNELPKVAIGVRYKNPYFTASANPVFLPREGKYAISGTNSFAVFYESFLAKLILEETENERLIGLKFQFRDTNLGLITSTKEAAYFSLETRKKNISAGFTCTQIFAMQESIWKVFSSTSIGARYHIPTGYIGVAWQRPNSLSAKLKCRISERIEAALMSRVDNYDFTKIGLAASFCLFPHEDDTKPTFDKVSKNVPRRAFF